MIFALVFFPDRVAACVAELTKLDLDARSTAAYGVAHILSSLTVTNRELRALALADKDITPEQYEQMQELQRIKTKDENGQTIEEKKVRCLLCLKFLVFFVLISIDPFDTLSRRILTWTQLTCAAAASSASWPATPCAFWSSFCPRARSRPEKRRPARCVRSAWR